MSDIQHNAQIILPPPICFNALGINYLPPRSLKSAKISVCGDLLHSPATGSDRRGFAALLPPAAAVPPPPFQRALRSTLPSIHTITSLLAKKLGILKFVIRFLSDFNYHNRSCINDTRRRHVVTTYMRFKILLAGVLLGLLSLCEVKAQDAAVKTNILSDIVLSPSVSAEVGLAPKWTFELTGQLNAWDVNEHYWKHWLVMPEGRYWFCRRFSGHFVGAHILGGQYNFGNLDNNIKFLGTDFSKLSDERHQGWMFGAGVAYGYSWIIDRRWNIEAEIGLGWVHTIYDVYPCAKCGTKKLSGKHHNYFGPTKAAINLIYTF